MSETIRPLHDRVVVERTTETKSAGGIVLPSNGEKPDRGIIRATGNGKVIDGKLQPLDVKIGDQVLFGKYAGTEIKVSGKDLLVIREEDIVGIIEG